MTSYKSQTKRTNELFNIVLILCMNGPNLSSAQIKLTNKKKKRRQVK